jgi:hypothetical protein
MRSFFFCVGLLNSASFLSANTIISVTGPVVGGGAILASQSLGSSWTQSTGYSNVVVSALLSEDTFCLVDCPAITLTAYLTTRIGPGTTAADEITHDTVAVSGGSYADRNLLSIPVLSPGTYYLTLFSSNIPGAVWAAANPPQVILDTGVTRNLDSFADNLVGYPPANVFISPPPIGSEDFQFSVTGTAIPEPSTTTLVGATLLTLLLKRYRVCSSNSRRPPKLDRSRPSSSCLKTISC